MIQLRKKHYLLILLLAFVVFMGWRFIRPLHIFLVSERFAWPVDTSTSPAVLGQLKAQQCGTCHPAFYKEWKTTIHSQAWTDPYFQADWKFGGSQPNCRLCHTPLDRQEPQKILSYRDTSMWNPVLEKNPHFDSALQHQGVTCAACHYRNGKIVGVLHGTHAPHPVKILSDPNEICVRCHVVKGKRWDTFYHFPPCGTVAEIRSTLKSTQNGSGNSGKRLSEKIPTDIPSITGENRQTHNSGETSATNYHALGCVQCHMPLIKRSLVIGGKVRITRRHLWRGGHDPSMVKKALNITFTESKAVAGSRKFILTITNTGAEHYVPTGLPNRYLSVSLRVLDKQGQVLDEQHDTIKRTLMWRPFIVDLWDTRLPRWQPRHYEIKVADNSTALKVEAVVKYHLLGEDRRKRISYKNTTPINYDVFHKQILLSAGNTLTGPAQKHKRENK